MVSRREFGVPFVVGADKLIAAEGNFNNGNTGWNVFAIPDQAQQRNYVQISLPNAESVFDFHNFSGDESVPGLKTIPQNLQPTVAPVFWGFRLMIYGAWSMLPVAFIGVIMRLRRRLWVAVNPVSLWASRAALDI